MMHLQRSEAWQPDRDLDWNTLDGSRPLFPIAPGTCQNLSLSADERRVLSQFVGLMVAQAISQHEAVLQTARRSCWEGPTKAFNMSHDLLELGEEFFQDERKHSETFARYVRTFAESKGVNQTELSHLLPRYSGQSWLARALMLNSRLGGRAIWWLVMLTEEESIRVFRRLRAERDNIDPLYFNLHRLHYEEEIRHMSFAPLMLRFLDEHSSKTANFIAKFDFLFMSLTHVIWVCLQLLRLRKIVDCDSQSPFISALKSIYLRAKQLPIHQLVRIAASELPSLFKIMSPLRHASIRTELRRTKGLGHQCLLRSTAAGSAI